MDYARSFFPVAVAVLLLRAFVFEPFRIPSDSMMPTLLDGDFILVDKFSYGLRLPVTNTKILDTGGPKRGDVVVFRYPLDPSENYIKRAVGLPGDHVTVRDDRLIINDEVIPFNVTGNYSDGCYINMQLAVEHPGSPYASGAALRRAAAGHPLSIARLPAQRCARLRLRRYAAARRAVSRRARGGDQSGADRELPHDRRQSRQQR